MSRRSPAISHGQTPYPMHARLWTLVAATLAVRASALLVDAPPPLLSVPTYSLATLNADGASTNMNILTYATPVGIKPVRRWAIALYRDTRTHANFVARGSGVLQMLCEEHAPLVYTLGGCSGAELDKAAACAERGFGWVDGAGAEAHPERLLPGCAAYLHLVQEGELTSCGEHDVAICRVERTLAIEGGPTPAEHQVSTGRLRELGLISALGRAVPPDGE